MKLKSFDAPHIHHPENTRALMIDAILAMLFLYGMAYFYHGPRVVALGLCSVLAASATDALCCLLAGKKPNPRDLSPVVTGLLLPLFMPVTAEYSVVIAAAVFGIAVAKHPFGGVGHNVFNPAAAGLSFALICFPNRLFVYPPPKVWLPVFGAAEFTPAASPSFTLALGGLPAYDYLDMLLGNYPGPIGATNILVLLACLLYLIFRGAVRWQLPLAFFASAALMVVLFPRGGPELGLDLAMRLRLMLYELMSGGLLLGAAFFLGDPVTTPKRHWAKAGFGFSAGIIVMLFRRYGAFEESISFAVLLMNATVWGFDMLGEWLASRARRRAKAA